MGHTNDDCGDVECTVCKDGLEEYRRKALDMISQFGWMVQQVGASEAMPPYFYTIGLYRFKLPEIMIIGPFTPNVISTLLNFVGNKMKKEGAFEDWSRSHDITQKFSVVFRELAPEAVTDYCVMMTNVVGESKKTLQMVLPDEDGNFPWDRNCKWKFQCERLTYASPEYLALIN